MAPSVAKLFVAVVINNNPLFTISVRACVQTHSHVSACVCDNSEAERIQSPPPPWEIKAISAAQDVGSEVIHTLGPGLPARGASALTSTSKSYSTHFTFKETRKRIALSYSELARVTNES